MLRPTRFDELNKIQVKTKTAEKFTTLTSLLPFQKKKKNITSTFNKKNTPEAEFHEIY